MIHILKMKKQNHNTWIMFNLLQAFQEKVEEVEPLILVAKESLKYYKRNRVRRKIFYVYTSGFTGQCHGMELVDILDLREESLS